MRVMKRILLYILPLLFVVLTSGCGSDGDSRASRILSNVTGSSGELVIVTEKSLWDGDLGKKLKEVFEVATPALPQYEPMFNLMQVTPAGFGKLYQNHRNILVLSVDPAVAQPKVTFQTDAYASSQILFKAVGPNSEAVVNEIINSKQLIIDKLTEAERDRWMRYFKRTQSSHNINRLRDQHGISMPVPAGYRVDETKPGFAWVALETPTTTQSVLIHYFKASGSSVFSRDSMIMIRNNMTKTEVEGSTPGTYMAIEERYPVEYRIFSHNGRNYAEIRGLWTLVNGFMGGPFITIMTYDEKNRRAVMLDGFVYAPNDNKRELMRQVEALLYSADFHSPEEATVVAKKPKEK
jgi:hypothetical protein